MAYIQSQKGETWLLPPSIEEMIPEDHICYLVEGIVESLDYSEFNIKYSGAGHPAYHPRVLLKLLIMGVMDKIRSSRKLARSARENVVYIYLSEKLTPDFRTISDFRKNNPELIKEAFKYTVAFAREEGLLDLTHLSTDGSKVKANTAKRILTKDELEVLIKFLNSELKQWTECDEEEDRQYGEFRGSDQVPKQSRRKLQEAMKGYAKKIKERGDGYGEEIKNKLQKAKKEMEDNKLKEVSLTDPESRFMRGGKGNIELSYNTQVTVDKRGMVLANGVSQERNDAGQMQGQVIETEENMEIPLKRSKWSFDNGYLTGSNLKFLEDKGIDGYIPDQNKKLKNAYDKRHFKYDREKDEYICPGKERLVFNKEYFDKGKGKRIRLYKGIACAECQQQRECTKRKEGVRYLKAYPYERERFAMIEKMAAEPAKEIYKLRRQTVERAFGDIKENKGIRSFLTRGLETVRTEFNIVCAAMNITMIWAHLKRNSRGRKLLYQMA